MRKFFVNLICCFVPSRKIRHKIRDRFFKKNTNTEQILDGIYGNNNKIIVIDENGVEQPSCFIGEDCMLSGLIRIYSADGHSVIDAETDDILNEATEPLQIGNHVWIGEGVRITKNACIHDNCIIAGGAVVCKDYKESGVVIAGNPGKIVKRNITWNRKNPYHLKQIRQKMKK